MRHFAFVGGGTEKFWEIARTGPTITVRFGRLGTNGQTQVKDLGTEAAAAAQESKLIAEKVRKGYVESAAATSQAPLPGAFLEDDEYLPEFSTVVIRDGWTDLEWGEPVPEVLEESFDEASICGSFARSGAGWLQASARDGYARVRLVAVNAAPVAAGGEWTDVMETPYLCTSGSVGLSCMTGSDITEMLPLGPPGFYRVRVHKRTVDDGDEWLFTFWPDAPPRLPRWLRRTEAPDAVHGLDGDLAHVAGWARGSQPTVAELSDLLLVPVAEVRVALAAASAAGVLAVSEDTGAPMTVSPLPRPEQHQETQTLEVGPPWDGSTVEEPSLESILASLPPGQRTFVHVRTSWQRQYIPPVGAPPRAGIVTSDGVIIVGLRSTPVTLAALGEHEVWRAYETPYGIVTLGHKARLVGYDGHVTELTAQSGMHGGLSTDGRLLAVQEDKFGRRTWHKTHLFDLASGEHWELPDNEARRLMVAADGAVHFGLDGSMMRWVPGHAPVQHGPADGAVVDLETGRRLTWIGPHASRITDRDGRSKTIVWPEALEFAPGGKLISFGFRPNRMTLHEESGQRFIHLPIDARTDNSFPPAWEDEDTVVISLDHPDLNFGGQALRVDTRDGTFEAVPFGIDAGYRPRLITPLRAGSGRS